MTLIEKRKSVQKGYVFTKGERCICWQYYPYNYRLAMIVGESKKYWIVDDGRKYKKSDYNLSGYTGYADAFIEPHASEKSEEIEEDLWTKFFGWFK